MTDMQTSLPLLIVRLSILNPVINFSTHLWPVKWDALQIYLCLAHSNSISSNVDATHAPTWSTMIWSTSYHHVIILVHRSWLHLLFTIAFVHWHQVFLKLYRHAVHLSKASKLSFTLAAGPSSQVLSWSSPPWSHDSMSCLICNELLHHHMCELCNISKLFSPSWYMLLTHMFLWTNHLCISYKHN